MSGQGGAREGAGRPRLAPSERVHYKPRTIKQRGEWWARFDAITQREGLGGPANTLRWLVMLAEQDDDQL